MAASVSSFCRRRSANCSIAARKPGCVSIGGVLTGVAGGAGLDLLNSSTLVPLFLDFVLDCSLYALIHGDSSCSLLHSGQEPLERVVRGRLRHGQLAPSRRIEAEHVSQLPGCLP